MKANKFGKREIMLVAHKVAKRCNQSFRESLKDAWSWFKSGKSDFFAFLGISIKEKRKNSLKNFNMKSFIVGMKDNTHASVSFEGWIWNEKYNTLFN